MAPDSAGLIVVTDGHAIPIRVTCVYHRHFPEVRGVGGSLIEASLHLAQQLARNLDHANGPGRETLEQALAVVRDLRTAHSTA